LEKLPKIQNCTAAPPEPFDLVLVNDNPDPRGAHVGVYLRRGAVLHLPQKIGVPAIESLCRRGSSTVAFAGLDFPLYRNDFIQ